MPEGRVKFLGALGVAFLLVWPLLEELLKDLVLGRINDVLLRIFGSLLPEQVKAASDWLWSGLLAASAIALTVYATKKWWPDDDQGLFGTRYIALSNIGLWLYRRGEKDFRKDIREGLKHEVFASIEEAGDLIAKDYAPKAGIDLYGRRHPRGPMEVIPEAEYAEPRPMGAVLEEENSPPIYDLSIRRSDLDRFVVALRDD